MGVMRRTWDDSRRSGSSREKGHCRRQCKSVSSHNGTRVDSPTICIRERASVRDFSDIESGTSMMAKSVVAVVRCHWKGVDRSSKVMAWNHRKSITIRGVTLHRIQILRYLRIVVVGNPASAIDLAHVSIHLAHLFFSLICSTAVCTATSRYPRNTLTAYNSCVVIEWGRAKSVICPSYGGSQSAITNMKPLTNLSAASSLSARRAASKLPRPYPCSYRCPLHSGRAQKATPVPYPPFPGQPPQPPQALPAQPEDRIARKRKQAELLQQGQEARVNAAKPGTALQKRFWKDVTVKTTDG